LGTGHHFNHKTALADVKPDNILVDWASDEDGNKTVTKAALGDFDIALQLKDGKPLYGPHAVGNVMWRSPEAQTGRGVTKASDVFSFGLVVGDHNPILLTLARTPPTLTFVCSASTLLEAATSCSWTTTRSLPSEELAQSRRF
jgi:serine/threonine protein kinase